MKRFKIETDGSYYYPYIRRFLWWEPIENYEIHDGKIMSTGSNQCSTIDRARELIRLARENLKAKKRRKVIWTN